MKKKLILILAPCTVAVLVAVALLVLWQTQWKKDPKPPVVETDTSAFSDAFFGQWHNETGKKEHSLYIVPNGAAIYKCGSDVANLRYSSTETDKITIWIDGYIYDLALEEGELIRYRKGKPDGYTYKKAGE